MNQVLQPQVTVAQGAAFKSNGKQGAECNDGRNTWALSGRMLRIVEGDAKTIPAQSNSIIQATKVCEYVLYPGNYMKTVRLKQSAREGSSGEE